MTSVAKLRSIIFAALLVGTSHLASAAGVDSSLIGYTVLEVSAISSDDGSGFERVVTLQNGSVYQISGFGLNALMFTKTVVFGRRFSAAEIATLGMQDMANKNPSGVALVKLLIGDTLYLAQKLK